MRQAIVGISWVVRGERQEAKVDARGVLIEHEVAIAADKVLAPVREAAQKALGQARDRVREDRVGAGRAVRSRGRAKC